MAEVGEGDVKAGVDQDGGLSDPNNAPGEARQARAGQEVTDIRNLKQFLIPALEDSDDAVVQLVNLLDHQRRRRFVKKCWDLAGREAYGKACKRTRLQ